MTIYLCSGIHFILLSVESIIIIITRVHQSGALKNIEDKDSLIASNLDKHTQSHIFQGHDHHHYHRRHYYHSIIIVIGGNWKDLHRMLSISSGDKILYVGDHMYADILRSKRTLGYKSYLLILIISLILISSGWRTCLVIPELENEIIVAQAEAKLGSTNANNNSDINTNTNTKLTKY